MRIRFDKIDGFIKIHDKIRCLVLFDYGYCDKTFDEIKHLLIEKRGVTDSTNHRLKNSKLTHVIPYLLKKS